MADSYNPDSPYVMGMQWAPVVAQILALDTGSEVGYTFTPQAADATVQRIKLISTVAPPGQPNRKELLANLYHRDDVAATGPIQKLTINCNSGFLGTGASLQGGPLTVQTAVSNPSDTTWVELSGASSYARFWFNVLDSRVSGALTGRRILDVTALYSVSGPFTDLPAAALTLSLERPSAAVVWDMDDTLTGPAAQTSNIVIGRSRLGELNPWCLSTTTPLATTERRPWRYGAGINNYVGFEQLAATGGTNIDVRITSSAAAAGMLFDIHYIALEVTYCQENRIGAGGLSISGGGAFLNNIFQYDIPFGALASYGANSSIVAGSRYAVTVGQSYSGVISVASPVPVSVNTLDSIDVFAPHEGILLRKTLRPNATHVAQTTATLPAGPLYDGAILPGTILTSTHAYLVQEIGTVSASSSPGDVLQLLIDDVAATYVWVRFYARVSPQTLGSLTVYQVNGSNVALGPQASVTVTAFAALPELANGWKQVTLRLSAPVVTTGAGTNRWTFSADTPVAAPWQVLGGDANPRFVTTETSDFATYGGETAFAINNAVSDLSGDFTVMLAQEMDTVTGLAVTPAIQALTVIDECCGLPVDCIPDGLNYHTLTWTALNTAVVAGWGYYEIARQDATMPATQWETIAQITAPNVTTTADYEARVGVATRYRIRMVHHTGIAGPWSATVTATIPAPGVTGTAVDVGVLLFTSNSDPAANLAYITTWPAGQAAEEFTFPEGTQTDLQSMYQRDYRVAFRPTERAGTEFTRTMLVNAACIPPSTMSAGFTDLRDLAWDTIPYVCVRNELANRWLAAIAVPSGSVRRLQAGHTMLAPVTIAEVTATPAPLDVTPACEGLRAEPGAAGHLAHTPLPAAVTGTTVITDSFDGRTIANGWGNADTGQPWSLLGTAANYAVAAGVGTHSVASVNAARITYFNTPTFKNSRSSVRMFPSAVALGAAGRSAILMRDDGTGANHYRVECTFGLAGVLSVQIVKRVAGADTQLATAAVSGTYIAGTQVHITAQIRGNFIEGKAWREGDAEPAYQVTASDAALTGAGRTGCRSLLSTGNTNVLPVTFSYDNWSTVSLWDTLDVRVKLRPNDTSYRWYVDQFDAATFGGWTFSGTPGVISLQVHDGGSFQVTVTPAAMQVVTNQLRWVRVTYQPNIGGGLAQADFYTSLDGTAWTLVSTQTATAEPLDIGAGRYDVSVDPGVSVVAVNVLSGIAGTTLASPNFGAQPAGTNTFTDAQANVWTVDGAGICAGG